MAISWPERIAEKVVPPDTLQPDERIVPRRSDGARRLARPYDFDLQGSRCDLLQTQRDLRFYALVLYSIHVSAPVVPREPLHLSTLEDGLFRSLRLIVVQSSTEVHRTSEGDWIWTIRTALVSSTLTHLSAFPSRRS
jgi:hypothetical protein